MADERNCFICQMRIDPINEDYRIGLESGKYVHTFCTSEGMNLRLTVRKLERERDLLRSFVIGIATGAYTVDSQAKADAEGVLAKLQGD